MSRFMKFIFDGSLELSLTEAMIEAVMKEWETEHPGQDASAMSSNEFADRLMKRVVGSARELPKAST